MTNNKAPMTTKRKAGWQFNQEGLPRLGSHWSLLTTGEIVAEAEAEASRLRENDREDGTYAAWERAFQQAVYDEARRCLNVIGHEDPDMTVEEMPAAVEDVADHLFLLGRGWRWGVLHGLLDEFEECAPVFWPLLMFWWCDGESNCMRSVVPMIKRALWWDGFGRMPHEFMSPENKTFFDALPETVTIYRGIYRNTLRPGRHIGISWTTDKTKAEWFARRFAYEEKKPVLLTGRVRKRNIIACFTGRNESEVVLLPKHVRGRTEEELPAVKEAAAAFDFNPEETT